MAEIDDIETSLVEFDPSSSVERFMALGLEPGDILTHDRLRQEVLQLPDPETANSHEAYEQRRFAIMKAWVGTQDALLKRHNVALQSVNGIGYRVVPPGEQAEWAAKIGRRKVFRTLAKTKLRIEHVDTTALTDVERRTRTDLLTRVSAMKQAAENAVRKDGDD